jgi:hypothetical protein
MEIAMKRRIATWAATITALACASPLRAHHSISMFEISAPIWVVDKVPRRERQRAAAEPGLEAAT